MKYFFRGIQANDERKQGMALLFAMVFMFIAFWYGLAFTVLIPYNARTTQRLHNQRVAVQVAKVGVYEARRLLTDELENISSSLSGSELFSAGDTFESDEIGLETEGWSYRYEIRRIENTPGAIPEFGYIVTAFALLQGDETIRIRVGLVQDFLSSWSSITGQRNDDIFLPCFPGMTQEGKVHFNDTLGFYIDSNLYQVDSDPIYEEVSQSVPVTSNDVSWDDNSQDGWQYAAMYDDNWMPEDAIPYEADPAQGETQQERYEKIAQGGLDPRNQTRAIQKLPQTVDGLKARSYYGGDSEDPNNPGHYLEPDNPGNGVFVNTNSSGEAAGGVYAEGTVFQLDMMVGSNDNPLIISDLANGNQRVFLGADNQVQRFYMEREPNSNDIDYEKYYLSVEVTDTPVTLPEGCQIEQQGQAGNAPAGGLIVDPGNMIVRDPDGKYTIIPGDSNGLTFVDGDILGLRGTNKGSHTVAVPNDEDRKIRIIDDITYHNTEPGERPLTGADNLGIIGHRVELDGARASNWDEDQGKPPLNLYASILGGNSETGGIGLPLVNPDDLTSYVPATGKANVLHFGCMIQQQDYPWANFDGDNWTGFLCSSAYPDFLSTQPPPFFPLAVSFRDTFYEVDNV